MHYTSVQASPVMCLHDLSSKNASSPNTTVIRSLWAWKPTFRPTQRIGIVVKKCIFLFYGKPRALSLKSKPNFKCGTNLVTNSNRYILRARTSSYGIESLSFLGCKLWNNLPDDFKSIKTLASCKRQINGWNDSYNCRLCKKFASHVGFLN